MEELEERLLRIERDGVRYRVVDEGKGLLLVKILERMIVGGTSDGN